MKEEGDQEVCVLALTSQAIIFTLRINESTLRIESLPNALEECQT